MIKMMHWCVVVLWGIFWDEHFWDELFTRGFTNERGRPKADRASQTYAWLPRKPSDIIRARLGLGRTLPSHEPGDLVRARLGLGPTLLDLLELPYRPTDRPLGTDRPTDRLAWDEHFSTI